MSDPAVAFKALDELLALAGAPDRQSARLEAGPPLLKTRFFAEEAAAATLAAGGVLAARLCQAPEQQTQTVTVSTREAGANLMGFTLQTFDDPALAPSLERPATAGATPAEGFFEAGDGRHVYLHPSFPPSAAKLHALMGSPQDREAAALAVKAHTGQALEDRIAEAGVCGGLVRTPEEWDASPQGQILATRPVVEVVRIGPSAPMPLRREREAPLSGVRVLDLTRVLAGPTCARTLAQYGAEALYITAPDLPTVPLFVADTNPGKRSAFLDLKTKGDRERLLDLIAEADIFAQGYRGGALDRLGLSPVELAALRPGLIYVSINCYGHEGPWQTRPGWEQLAQTVTGLAHLHGQHLGGDHGPPRLQPAAVCDYTTGFLAAFGALIALQRRATYGGSYLVRVSLVQTAVWLRSLGLAPAERLDATRGLDPSELAAWRIHGETGYGGVHRLRPAVQMGATPTRWREPLARLGAHPPAWAIAP